MLVICNMHSAGLSLVTDVAHQVMAPVPAELAASEEFPVRSTVMRLVLWLEGAVSLGLADFTDQMRLLSVRLLEKVIQARAAQSAQAAASLAQVQPGAAAAPEGEPRLLTSPRLTAKDLETVQRINSKLQDVVDQLKETRDRCAALEAELARP
ncbi:unnamed protein product [Prorocentrum cordatum]|uniref:Uncharacterized protein n=1 Tax=Prorocentrum cordatum TaxID=2364126 RepID=A0ABN9VWH0_9DINO|nr:unnamed protein product [Polarella glacialis]